jgi:hypothetical protein
MRGSPWKTAARFGLETFPLDRQWDRSPPLSHFPTRRGPSKVSNPACPGLVVPHAAKEPSTSAPAPCSTGIGGVQVGSALFFPLGPTPHNLRISDFWSQNVLLAKLGSRLCTKVGDEGHQRHGPAIEDNRLPDEESGITATKKCRQTRNVDGQPITGCRHSVLCRLP